MLQCSAHRCILSCMQTLTLAQHAFFSCRMSVHCLHARQCKTHQYHITSPLLHRAVAGTCRIPFMTTVMSMACWFGRRRCLRECHTMLLRLQNMPAACLCSALPAAPYTHAGVYVLLLPFVHGLGESRGIRPVNNVIHSCDRVRVSWHLICHAATGAPLIPGTMRSLTPCGVKWNSRFVASVGIPVLSCGAAITRWRRPLTGATAFAFLRALASSSLP